MVRRWLTLSLLILATSLASAQSPVPVMFAWDVDPYAASAEIERDGVQQPCPTLESLPTEHRCTVSWPVGTATFRARMANALGAWGPWSEPLVGTVPQPGSSAPGPVTVVWHSPIALPEPEPEPEPTMAALHDGQANISGRITSNTTTWTLTGKTTTGTNRLGVVRWLAGLAPSTVTWGGVAMTNLGTTVVRGSQTIRMFYILNPPTAASDIVITNIGPTTGAYLVTSYNGVDQTDPIGDVQTATGTSTTPSVTVTSATDELVIDAMDVANVISSVGAGQTAEYLDTTGSSDRFGGSYEAGAASVTMSWTVSSGAWATMGVALMPVAAAVASLPPPPFNYAPFLVR